MGRRVKGSRVSTEPNEGWVSSHPADDAAHLLAGRALGSLLDTRLANISQDANQLGRLLPHAQSNPRIG